MSQPSQPVDLPPTTSVKPPMATTKPSPPSELVIQTLSKPSNSDSLRKAAKGDKVSVHYVRIMPFTAISPANAD